MMSKKMASQNESKKKTSFISGLFSRLIGLVLLSVPILIIWAFVTGEVQFVETSSFGGESWGYFGVRSKLMDSPEKLKEAFDLLKNKEEFEGSEPAIFDINYNSDRISVTVHVPGTRNYVDTYTYDGRYKFKRWTNRPSENVFYIDDEQNLIHPGVKLSDIDFNGMYHFLKQIKDYQKDNQIEAEYDHMPSANLDIKLNEKDEPTMHLTGYLNSVRETYNFRADANGENFEVDSGLGFSSVIPLDKKEERAQEMQISIPEQAPAINQEEWHQLTEQLNQELEAIIANGADNSEMSEAIDEVINRYEESFQKMVE